MMRLFTSLLLIATASLRHAKAKLATTGEFREKKDDGNKENELDAAATASSGGNVRGDVFVVLLLLLMCMYLTIRIHVYTAC